MLSKKNVKVISKVISFVLIATAMLSVTGCQNASKEDPNSPKKIVWYYPGKVQPEQDIVFEAINEKLRAENNFEIDHRVIDSGSYQEKMNMVIASNEAYDVCFTSNWTNKYLPNVLKKAYAPLQELLDTDAVKLKEALPDFVWNAARFDDDIYAVPNYQVMFYQPALCVPQVLYDKYSEYLQDIKEAKDLEPYLEQIKQNEPKLYPYRIMDAAMWLKYEGIYGAEVGVMMGEPSARVFNPYTTPEYKEHINLMSEWFQKGYIRKDIAGVTSDTDDIKNLRYAVWDSQLKPGIEYYDSTGKKIDMVYIPLGEPYLTNGAGTQAMTAISASSKDIKSALKMVEIMNTNKEIYNLLCFGLEGTHYTMENNKVKLTEGSKYSPKTDWEFGNQFNALIIDTKPDGIWEETDQKNRDSKPSAAFGFVFNPESVKTEIANITSVKSEFKYLEQGSENVEEGYNTFVKKLSDSGIDKVIEETQKQLDAWKN